MVLFLNILSRSWSHEVQKDPRKGGVSANASVSVLPGGDWCLPTNVVHFNIFSLAINFNQEIE
jgi:hypothetical protein